MKKEQKKRESIGKKFFSGLVMVLSVALYFISEGFIRLSNKAQKNSSGNTAEKPKTRRSKAAAKRREKRPNPVTAARQAEEQASAAAVAPAVRKPQKQSQTAARKPEKQAAVAAVPASAARKPEKQAAVAAVPASAARKPEKQAAATAAAPVAKIPDKKAPVASAPAAHKPEKQASVAAPVVQKPEKKSSPAVNAPEEQTPTEAAPEAAKKPEKQGLFGTAFAAKKAEKGAKADTAAKAFPTGLKPVTTAAPKAPEKPVVPAASRVPQTSGKLDRTIAAVTADKQPKEQAEKNPRKTIIIILFCLLVIAICVLAGIGIKRLTASIRAKNIYDDLASSVQQAKDPAYNPTTAPLVTEPVDESSDDAAEPTQPVVETVPPETEPQMLPQYAPLYEKNSDLFGWVKIEDTKIDYPVMYAPNDLERYLYHDFERNSYSGGTPYMDVRCTPDSENYLIYGHNMKNGTMFKHLLNYQSEKFWKEHPTVYFDTLYEEGEYEVVAAFYDRVYYSYEDVFKFYNVIELEDEDSYDDAIANLRKKSIYDTGVVPAYGTQLVTLITCAYHVDNGKFVVVLAEKAAG